jgi:ribosomal protein L31
MQDKLLAIQSDVTVLNIFHQRREALIALEFNSLSCLKKSAETVALGRKKIIHCLSIIEISSRSHIFYGVQSHLQLMTERKKHVRCHSFSLEEQHPFWVQVGQLD